MKQYDLIVIGSGGVNIVLDAALKKGLSCAIIEKGKFGGTCLTRGCIPTKVMVTAADAIHEIREFRKIGINVSEAIIDWDKVSQRVWEKIDESKGVQEYYEAQENCDVYPGIATFTGEKEIIVTFKDGSKSEKITATNIVIGTGAQSMILPLPGLEEASYITSESFFGPKYPDKPYKSLIILGGGPIATEFAHIFNSAGTEVTLIQRSEHLLKKEDVEISIALKKAFIENGINVETGTKLLDVKVKDGKKVVRFERVATGEICEAHGEEILLATGVVPAIKELGLENTSIEQLKNGWIKTNEFLETSVAGVYALGDINGAPPFRHKANYEADILAHNLYIANSPTEFRWARYDLVPAVTYTYPQVGHIGMTEAEAKAAGYNVGIGKNSYANCAKGFAMGFDSSNADEAFVKIVVDKDTNHILGMHCVGPQASILFQPFVNLLNVGETKLKPINEDIASETTKKLRKQGLTRYLDPKSVISVGETMTAHPSLTEVIMWTQVYYEHRW